MLSETTDSCLKLKVADLYVLLVYSVMDNVAEEMEGQKLIICNQYYIEQLLVPIFSNLNLNKPLNSPIKRSSFLFYKWVLLQTSFLLLCLA